MQTPPLRTLRALVDTFASRGEAVAVQNFGNVSRPGAAAEASTPEAVSYAQLHETIVALAQGLRERGIGAGDMVWLCAPNSPAWIAAYFGIVCSGAAAVPVDDQASRDMRAAVLRHSGARFALTTARHVEELADTPAAPTDYALLDRDDGDSAWTRIRGNGASLPEIEPGGLASLLYTSGTTGKPKAVPLTHANLASNATALLTEDLIRPSDRVLMPLPFHHTYPFTLGLLSVLGTGATLVLPAGVTGPEITGAAKRSAATAMLGVPSLYEAVWQGIDARVKMQGARKERLFRRLLAFSGRVRQLTKLRAGKLLFRPLHDAIGPQLEILGCGGAKLDSKLAENLEALGWTVLTGYGLTETSPVLTFNSRSHRRLGSEGRALPGVELRIAQVPEAAHGEILARGPNVFDGYWHNPEATENAFDGDWFRTGDLGWVDDDGYLHVVGRLKEVIVLADGKNIFPEDLEPAYSTSPLLRELAILEHGGSLVALVVPDDDEVRRRGGLGALRLLKEELERVALQLPAYQRVVDFRAVREPMPRTRLGKLKRHELPELYERAGQRTLEDQPVVLSDEDRALIEKSDRTRRVWAWLEQRYPDRKLHPDMSPQLDLKIDSLGWVTMTLELEQAFGISLSGEVVSRIMTLRDLLTEVDKAEESAAVGLAPAAAPKPQGPFLRALGAVLYGINRLLIRTFYRLRVSGLERLPREACVAVTPNHLSYLDPLAVAAALPRRVVRNLHWAGWVGKMYAGPVSTLVSRSTRVFPVDPDQDLSGALGTARALLDRSASIVWFPEGRRSPTGELQPFRPGIGMLLKGSSCMVVPAFVTGTYEAWPIQQRMPRPGGELSVVFGEPVEVSVLAVEGEGETEEMRIVDALHRRVAALGGVAAAVDRGSPAASERRTTT
ncbi:MAG: AMP-binding protein [Gammaproteobacteria bacterium]|nr:AMP-binding protein [Gammaproteobacteria bacterium]